MRTPTLLLRPAALLTLALFAATGCSSSTEPAADVPATPARSPEAAVRQMVAAWNGRSVDLVAVTLAEDYEFLSSSADSNRNTTGLWLRYDELLLVREMFEPDALTPTVQTLRVDTEKVRQDTSTIVEKSKQAVDHAAEKIDASIDSEPISPTNKSL